MPFTHPSGARCRARYLLAASFLTALALSARLPATELGKPEGDPGPGGAAPPAGRAAAEPRTFEVLFTDHSTLKLVLKDERLPLSTPYGKLLIPVADIRRIDFASRVPEDVARRVEAAITSVGNPQFRRREEACAELVKLRERAYPALLRATRHPDPEVVRRAEEVLDKLRESVPEEELEVRPFDVVQTEHSKIAGRIEGAALKATTFQFGDVQLKLTDLRNLHALGEDTDPEALNPSPDPGNLVNLQNQIGKSFAFRVTGATAGSLWGTDVYTLDSTLAMAVVHTGILQPGQTGVVKVKIVASPPIFQGSTRNGVTSAPYGPYPGGAFQVSR